MEKIFHPVSGEEGYFATDKEKTLIDAVLSDYVISQLVVNVSSHSDVRGVEHE